MISQLGHVNTGIGGNQYMPQWLTDSNINQQAANVSQQYNPAYLRRQFAGRGFGTNSPAYQHQVRMGMAEGDTKRSLLPSMLGWRDDMDRAQFNLREQQAQAQDTLGQAGNMLQLQGLQNQNALFGSNLLAQLLSGFMR